MDRKRVVVENKDANGKNIKVFVLRPTNKIMQEAQLEYNIKVAQLLRENDNNKRLMLKSEVEDYLKRNGLWSRKDGVKLEQLAIELRACEAMLKEGGIKLSEAKDIAFKAAQIRKEMYDLMNKRQQLDSITIESIAEHYKLYFLMVKCVVDENNNQVFKNIDDYIERSDEPFASDAAIELTKIVYNISDDESDKFFEVKFLKEAGMIDDKGRFITKDGKYIDKDGRLVNEKGQYINENGELIDKAGNLVDDYGNIIFKSSKPFIDDETGKEIFIGQKSKKKKSKKKTNK